MIKRAREPDPRGPPTACVRLRATLRLSLLLLLGASGALSAVHAFEFEGRAEIIDGDSLFIGQQEMRLQGIDAPEGQQTCRVKAQDWRCGQAAAETLMMLVTRHKIRCQGTVYDQYRRALVTCYRDDINLNAMMVEVGMALAYRYHSLAYAEQEDLARAKRRGIWDSEFMPPWDWRRAQRAQAALNEDCPVKGNVNRNGDKIYHLRDGRDYARVRINAAEGDRCFDTESDARAEGFRAPRR